jgi:pimeloyl-ACP methyl ester carboxylesterase
MLATPFPTEREAAIEAGVAILKQLAAPGFPPTDEEIAEVREVLALAYERGRDPEATFRQLAAILVAPPRTENLRALRMPALVIHGAGDRLIPPVGGELTAGAIPGARHVVIEEMGHDLPRRAWPRIVKEITALTEQAERTESTEGRTASAGARP